MAVFLWRAWIQEMMCSTSEAADSSPGHRNCAGTPDTQGGMHMEHHSRHSRGVMLGELRHSCWWPGVQGSSARALSSHGGQGTALSVSHPPSRCSNRYLWQEDNQGRTSLDNWDNMKELECRSDSEGKGVKLPKQTGKSHKKLS